MMKKHFYYLNTCNTCKRILKELELNEDFTLQNLKEQPLTSKEIETLKEAAGSYEALFNRRSVLYRERKLKDQHLQENDYKELLEEHYSFVKRPILVVDTDFFIGNAKKTIVAAKELLLTEKNN